MKVLIPEAITLLTTNVPETDYPEYNAGTTYTSGDKVMVASEHKTYESLATSNIGNTPSTSPTKWALMGYTNAHKCIDEKVSSQTIKADSIEMTFSAGKATSIAFLNVECESLTVTLKVGSDVIYTETKTGVVRYLSSWYNYFFQDFEYITFFTFSHMLNPTATYTVTLTGAMCKLGVMVKGTMFTVGETLWNSGLGYIDYSKMDTDQWGETYLAEGAVRDTFRGEVAIPTYNLTLVRKKLIERRGKLSLYIPTDVYDMPVYGWIREPNLVWQNPKISICTFDIEGVA